MQQPHKPARWPSSRTWGHFARATSDGQRSALVDTHRLCCLRGRHCANSLSATANFAIAIEMEQHLARESTPSL